MAGPCDNRVHRPLVRGVPLRDLDFQSHGQPRSSAHKLCGAAAALILMAAPALAQVAQQGRSSVVPPPPLVLAGGTVVDVTNWGHSADDLKDAVIYIRDGRVTAVGPRSALPIPKGSRVIDCTGKYLIPGLIDGFAGTTSAAILTCMQAPARTFIW